MKTPLIALAAAGLVAAAAPTSAPAAVVREVEGTVVSVDRDARTFRLRDEGRSVTVRVTRATRYERLAGFRSLRRGMRNIEATVRRSNGRWVAIEVERSGRDRARDDD